jgi:hypothetical protein
MMPKRSKASRSNQFAAGQTSTSEAITGNSSSGQKARKRRRQLFFTERRCTTTAKRGPSRGWSA